jgi:hypothetical protein
MLWWGDFRSCFQRYEEEAGYPLFRCKIYPRSWLYDQFKFLCVTAGGYMIMCTSIAHNGCLNSCWWGLLMISIIFFKKELACDFSFFSFFLFYFKFYLDKKRKKLGWPVELWRPGSVSQSDSVELREASVDVPIRSGRVELSCCSWAVRVQDQVQPNEYLPSCIVLSTDWSCRGFLPPRP